jgi:hypothetical protein
VTGPGGRRNIRFLTNDDQFMVVNLGGPAPEPAPDQRQHHPEHLALAAALIKALTCAEHEPADRPPEQGEP